MRLDQNQTKSSHPFWARRPSKMQRALIIGLALVGVLWAGFTYLRGPSTSHMSEALEAIRLPGSFHPVGTVHVHSGGSFAGDCYDACDGGDFYAENRQSTSASNNEKNLEAADALVRAEGWQLVYSYKNDSAYQRGFGEPESESDSVENVYCKSRMQLEVSSGLRHPFDVAMSKQEDADLIAGLTYSLASRSCSY